MKFIVSVSKLENFIFFLKNLSCYHFSCQKAFNQQWLLETGKLTSKEKAVLKELRGLLKNTNHPKELLKKFKAKSLFKNRFETIWQKERKILERWKKVLKRELNKRFFDQLLDELSVLYSTHFKRPSVGICLLLSAKDLLAGEVEDGRIAIKCSGLEINKKNLRKIESVIFHELVHANLEEEVKKLIRKYIRKRDLEEFKKTKIFRKIRSLSRILRELILSSFLPRGYLGEKYFSDNLRKSVNPSFLKEIKSNKNLSNLEVFIAYKLYPLAKKYIEEKRPIDFDFLEKIISKWKEYEVSPLKSF